MVFTGPGCAFAQAGSAAWLGPGYSNIGDSIRTVQGGLTAGNPIVAPWGCYAGRAGCVGQVELRSILERRRRFEELRQEVPPAQTGAAAGVWKAPVVRYLPMPTPEDQIVPARRDSSVVLPQFRDSGTPLQTPGSQAERSPTP